MRRIGNYAIANSCNATHSLLLDASLDDLHALGVEGDAAGAVNDLRLSVFCGRWLTHAVVLGGLDVGADSGGGLCYGSAWIGGVGHTVSGDDGVGGRHPCACCEGAGESCETGDSTEHG